MAHPTADDRRQAESALDRRARRDAVRRNAAKGPARNLEEAVRLIRAGESFRNAFGDRR